VPERPFIPSSTPTPRRTASTAAFHLARPFVHGASTPEAEPYSALPLIDDFLESRESYDLPPVEHFLDPLPLVDSFGSDGGDVLIADAPERDVSVASDAYQTEDSEMFGLEDRGWVDTGWQQFDWSGAAALGEGSAEASDAWLETDWETTAPPVRDFRETAAQAIANALDQIAHRIRNGELVLPPPNLTTDPAAIAATLAALLGVRR
jgi:hypothetical protein